MPHGAALCLGIVQFLFVTCWTIHVVFLPGLLESAGLSLSYTIWIAATLAVAPVVLWCAAGLMLAGLALKVSRSAAVA